MVAHGVGAVVAVALACGKSTSEVEALCQKLLEVETQSSSIGNTLRYYIGGSYYDQSQLMSILKETFPSVTFPLNPKVRSFQSTQGKHSSILISYW